MTEPIVPAAELVDSRLSGARLWCAAVVGGFLLGALPFSLLGVFWAPLAAISLLAWPVVALGIVYVAHQGLPESAEPVRADAAR